MGVFSFDFHPMMLGMYLPYRAADQPLRPDPDGTSAFHCSPLDVGFLAFCISVSTPWQLAHTFYHVTSGEHSLAFG